MERARGAARVWRELPLWFAEGGELVEGVVDLVFEEDGELVVVDYKTDQIGPEQALAQAAHHAPQLQLYGRGLAQATGLRVKERLVLFTAIGEASGLTRRLSERRHPERAKDLAEPRQILRVDARAGDPQDDVRAMTGDDGPQVDDGRPPPTVLPHHAAVVTWRREPGLLLVGLAPRHLLQLPPALLLLLLRRRPKTRDPAAEEALGPAAVGRAASSTRRSRASCKTRDACPRPTEQEAIIRAAVHGRDALQLARERGRAPRAFRLFEHEYEVPVEPEDKKIVVGTVMRSLRNFFRSERCARSAPLGRERWLTVEDLVSLRGVGDARCSCAWTWPTATGTGRVVIVDWKTGRGEGRFNEVQLAGYALYAARAGLGRQTRRRSRPSSPTWRSRATCGAGWTGGSWSTRAAFIEKSAGNMKALLVDPLANLARLEDFPMIDRPRICRRCNFRRLCFPRAEDAGLLEAPAAP